MRLAVGNYKTLRATVISLILHATVVLALVYFSFRPPSLDVERLQIQILDHVPTLSKPPTTAIDSY